MLCLQEFRRLSATLGAARDRAELFGGSSESASLAVGARKHSYCASAGTLCEMCSRSPGTNQAILMLIVVMLMLQGQASSTLLLRERGSLANSNAAVSVARNCR